MNQKKNINRSSDLPNLRKATEDTQDKNNDLRDKVFKIIEDSIQEHEDKLAKQEKELAKLKNDIENKLASLEPMSNEDIEKSFNDAIKDEKEEKK